MTNIDKMFIADERANPCAFNQKRLHNPQNREAAFSFDMHELVLKMWGASLVAENNPEIFKHFLERLKLSISNYEALTVEESK